MVDSLNWVCNGAAFDLREAEICRGHIYIYMLSEIIPGLAWASDMCRVEDSDAWLGSVVVIHAWFVPSLGPSPVVSHHHLVSLSCYCVRIGSYPTALSGPTLAACVVVLVCVIHFLLRPATYTVFPARIMHGGMYHAIVQSLCRVCVIACMFVCHSREVGRRHATTSMQLDKLVLGVSRRKQTVVQ